jgi:hypothetical protein
MNRYIVIDLKDYILYSTHDLKYLREDEFDEFGGSVACLSIEDMKNEINNWLNEEIRKRDTE